MLVCIEGRFRFYRNTQPNSPNYFSPERLYEPLAILRLRRKLTATWRFYIEGGLGRQILDPNSLSPTLTQTARLLEVGLSGSLFGHVAVEGFFGYSDQALQSTTGFARNYAGARVIIPFD